MSNIYDIVINQDHELEVNLYYLRMCQNEDGKRFYKFHYYRTIPVTVANLSDTIVKLNKDGYESSIAYNPSDFGVLYSYPGYMIKSCILPLNHKLLEKGYDIVIIDGIPTIYLYVTYVNVRNGELQYIQAGNVGAWSTKKEEALEMEGFQPIQASFLGRIEQVNTRVRKPVKFNKNN